MNSENNNINNKQNNKKTSLIIIIVSVIIIAIIGPIAFLAGEKFAENEPTKTTTTGSTTTTKVENNEKEEDNNKLDGLYVVSLMDEEVSKLIDSKNIGDKFEYNISDNIKLISKVESDDGTEDYKTIESGNLIIDGKEVYSFGSFYTISINIMEDYIIICDYLDQLVHDISVQTKEKVLKEFSVQRTEEFKDILPYRADIQDGKLIISSYADSDIDGKCLVTNDNFYSVKYEFTKEGKYKILETKESKYPVAGQITGDCE